MSNKKKTNCKQSNSKKAGDSIGFLIYLIIFEREKRLLTNGTSLTLSYFSSKTFLKK